MAGVFKGKRIGRGFFPLPFCLPVLARVPLRWSGSSGSPVSLLVSPSAFTTFIVATEASPTNVVTGNSVPFWGLFEAFGGLFELFWVLFGLSGAVLMSSNAKCVDAATPHEELRTPTLVR